MLARWPLILSVLAVGCATDPIEEESDGGGGGKEDRGGAGFAEVNPSHSTLTFRRYVERAIVKLETSDVEIANLTARAIRDGKVELDELVDLSCWDFERARADLPDAGFVPADYHRLHDRASPVAKALTDALDGYMWSDRIYVSRGQTTASLAATLVHEVNHVINRSEVGYYANLPTSGFVHEYRAFYTETMFDPDAYADVDLADLVLTEYDLDRTKISAAVLANPLTGTMLPDAAAWRSRRVSEDPRDIDADCPANQ